MIFAFQFDIIMWALVDRYIIYKYLEMKIWNLILNYEILNSIYVRNLKIQFDFISENDTYDIWYLLV